MSSIGIVVLSSSVRRDGMICRHSSFQKKNVFCLLRVVHVRNEDRSAEVDAEDVVVSASGPRCNRDGPDRSYLLKYLFAS